MMQRDLHDECGKRREWSDRRGATSILDPGPPDCQSPSWCKEAKTTNRRRVPRPEDTYVPSD